MPLFFLACVFTALWGCGDTITHTTAPASSEPSIDPSAVPSSALVRWTDTHLPLAEESGIKAVHLYVVWLFFEADSTGRGRYELMNGFPPTEQEGTAFEQYDRSVYFTSQGWYQITSCDPTGQGCLITVERTEGFQWNNQQARMIPIDPGYNINQLFQVLPSGEQVAFLGNLYTWVAFSAADQQARRAGEEVAFIARIQGGRF